MDSATPFKCPFARADAWKSFWGASKTHTSGFRRAYFQRRAPRVGEDSIKGRSGADASAPPLEARKIPWYDTSE